MLSTVQLTNGKAPWLHLPSDESSAPCIHLSPANGIPIGSYKGFIEYFDKQVSFTGMDSRGAWEGQAPPANNFRLEQFADDLIEAIELKHSTPIIGMGHSHGGLITCAAATKRPDLFSKLVIIDTATMPTPLIGWGITHMPKWLAHKLIPIVRGSYNRQRVWPSRDAFYQRYRKHGTFKRFTDQAMRDYAQYGLRARADEQFELVYHPSWESHIFRTVGFAWNHLRKVQVPSLLIRAEHSTLYSHQQFTHYNKRLPDNYDTLELAGTHHLLTHENPEQTSIAIRDWLEKD